MPGVFTSMPPFSSTGESQSMSRELYQLIETNEGSAFWGKAREPLWKIAAEAMVFENKLRDQQFVVELQGMELEMLRGKLKQVKAINAPRKHVLLVRLLMVRGANDTKGLLELFHEEFWRLYDLKARDWEYNYTVILMENPKLREKLDSDCKWGSSLKSQVLNLVQIHVTLNKHAHDIKIGASVELGKGGGHVVLFGDALALHYYDNLAISFLGEILRYDIRVQTPKLPRVAIGYQKDKKDEEGLEG